MISTISCIPHYYILRQPRKMGAAFLSWKKTEKNEKKIILGIFTSI
jgi:hypothetical protein